ncbi:NAD(P)-binding protein [Thozetella sp. PMI_491]|nr:NAD(P)-binding protein [Thozetella sp. PMI_491]
MQLTEHLTVYPALATAIKHIDLAGKSVLITGGGYGIGVDIARSFAERNVSSLILVGRTESKLKASASFLASAFPGTTTSYQVADISSRNDVQRLFHSLGENSPDIIINNAGYLHEPASFVDIDLSEWWKTFTINVLGTAMVTQAYLQHRRLHNTSPPVASKEAAVVVNVNTFGAYSMRIPQLSGYASSKAALMRWNELISVDVPETEARFISVHPGAIATDMASKADLLDTWALTDAKLTADFIVWLTSSDASFLAGRFVWVNWDVEELLAHKDEIVGKDMLRSSLST